MKQSRSKNTGRTLGIIGGLGSLAGGDLFLKLLKSEPVLADQGRYHLLFEQHPFKDLALPLSREASMTSRKLYVFQVCQGYAESGADAVLIPCFASHTFMDELQAELDIPIVDMMAALKRHVNLVAEPGARLGILASDYVRAAGLFERHFGAGFELVYPSEVNQAALMEAVYGPAGIKAGHLDGVSIELLHQACLDLHSQGATLLLPGMTELSLVASDLHRRGVSCVDVNQVYADYATSSESARNTPQFKLGIVGGVGPAATVDFMGKVVKNTPAGRDQDHIKMVVEQNPQIPDRTANILYKDTDPTVAMYATCKRLECEGANAIAIPCNTAHAYVERIQGYLGIPIINMLTETIDFIRQAYGSERKVGLLATSGTIQSRVYHHAAERVGLSLLVPDEVEQALVMSAIYGESGVKAGHTSGQCRDELLTAVSHLVKQGATVLILGCTELPLILPQDDDFQIDGVSVSLVDPTNVLAQRCVALARSITN
ncbi:TPA: aspartate/glutamate racemase family protein [Pseudomonas aeruginosa]|nr:aspartate/glutamate racemase family protein [Pseudomonas aeruginosa]MBX6684078.1 aspartate/glutamate racemase family protein [Pseudomonas aeruginosa]HCE5853587.1 aspartate/glutamate racemase family protein [Pseudomonas aeruginosa]HEP9216586.1 aspartate/glutamate racemase family protein [Pseudomonas aeruginosa]HEP9248053.1 aspartate/glutamate racemase family protein [Pseudomonas aeruginosa]